MEIKSIAIIGATHLGRRIAREAARAGYHAILEDVSPAALEQGIAWIAQTLADEVADGRIRSAELDAALVNLRTAASAEEASREADLILEAVADEMEIKTELFTIFDKFAKPGAVFASTTTSLFITDLAAVTFCPERCIGVRFSAGAQNANSLELIKGRETSEEIVEACGEIGRRMGKQVLVTNEEQVLNANADD